MARRVRDAKLETRAARSKLPPRGKPYYKSIGPQLHVGYRRNTTTGGVWVVRAYAGDGKYKVETIGAADDMLDADGQKVLNFWQAQDRARERHRQLPAERLGPPLTVKAVVEEYLAAREASRLPDGSYRLKGHVLSDPIAGKLLSELTSGDLAAWRAGLAAKGLKAASVTRTSADLKAALNAATVRHSKQLPAGFPLEVKNGLKSSKAGAPAARPLQVLPDADIRAILAAGAEVDAEGDWGGDLYMLLVLLAATGARFSQVARITVGDVQVAQWRIMVPVSHKGQGAKAVTHTARRVGADVLALLKPALAGRTGHEPLLRRPRWKQTARFAWVKVSRGQWLNPSELSRPWKTVRQKAGLSADIVPYAFRHSSIVRGLREGLPVRLVAAQHDTSSAMIEKHYAAYIVDAMDELSARAVVPLLSAPVSPLKQVGAA
jgi:integrase